MTETSLATAGLVQVIDDDLSIQASLSTLLEAAGYRVAVYGATAELPEITPRDCPACILLDMEMPGLNGLEFYRQLAGYADLPPVIFLTAHGDVPASVSAIKSGAFDFLLKPANPQHLLQVIARALEFDQERIASRAIDDSIRRRIDSLSVRERQVVSLVADGRLNKQIARELGITIGTVKVHRGRAMTKLQVDSVMELVRIADRFGLTTTRAVAAGGQTMGVDETATAAVGDIDDSDEDSDS
jgi:FixJ family two-component response regulator